MDTDEKASYIFTAQPRVQADDAAEWEGKVSAIRAAVEKGNKSIRDTFKKNVNVIQGDINMAVSRVQVVDDKVDALQGMTQHLMDTVEKVLDSTGGRRRGSSTGRRDTNLDRSNSMAVSIKSEEEKVELNQN